LYVVFVFYDNKQLFLNMLFVCGFLEEPFRGAMYQKE